MAENHEAYEAIAEHNRPHCMKPNPQCKPNTDELVQSAHRYGFGRTRLKIVSMLYAAKQNKLAEKVRDLKAKEVFTEWEGK